MILMYLTHQKKKIFILIVLIALMCIEAVVFAEVSDTASQPNFELADGVIIKFSDTEGHKHLSAAKRVTSFVQKLGLPLKYKRPMSNNAHVLAYKGVQSIDDVAQIVERLMNEPNLLYAEPNAIMHPTMVPIDPEYHLQWHYYEKPGGINAERAWNHTAGDDVVVAVIDTGYLPHADLIGNILPGYDLISDPDRSNDGDGRDSDAMDPGDWKRRSSSWHGTHVAGTIAAVSNNNRGVAGVAWKAKILPVRVLGTGGGTLADIADGIEWAAGLRVPDAPKNPNPAKVINLSLGGSGVCGRTFQDAIYRARYKGATIVVSAGNDDDNAIYKRPANCKGVICVAATDRDGNKADYSNYGRIVDLAAPGGDRSSGENGVYSTSNSGSTIPEEDAYEFKRGTSMAAPHVSGVAAMLYHLDPEILPNEVEYILEITAKKFPGHCYQCGTGIVDAYAAIESFIPQPSIEWLPSIYKLMLK